MNEGIIIRNCSKELAEIDIEGIIGIPETRQFDNPGERVATYERFRERIEAIRNIAAREIAVNLRSAGGNVNDALLIFDALKESGRSVTTRCYGYVASAATIIAQAASQGRREISQNALYLIHKSSSSAEGNADNLSQAAELLDKTDRRIAGIYAERSGESIVTFTALMSCNNGNGKWLDAREAVEASLADRIIGTGPPRDATETPRKQRQPETTQTNLPKNDPMTIKRQWNALLDLLGFNPEKEKALTEVQLEQLDTELSSRAERAEKLQDRISDLEAENARLKAKATRTKTKEDPGIEEMPLTGNARAYSEDIRNFR